MLIGCVSFQIFTRLRLNVHPLVTMRLIIHSPNSCGILILGIDLVSKKHCMHIYHFEQMGSIEKFLRAFIDEYLQLGMEGPMSKEAMEYW